MKNPLFNKLTFFDNYFIFSLVKSLFAMIYYIQLDI